MEESTCAGERRAAPRWAKPVLLAAAAYNILWGAVVVLFPVWTLEAAGLANPAYPQLWQCVGMIVGVYGVGYGVAAFNPVRHWPIILVGLLGKIFGPVGFLWHVLGGSLPWALGLTIIFNDLVWWVPFALVLRAAWEHHGRRRGG